MSYEVEKTMVFSTAHISKEQASKLNMESLKPESSFRFYIDPYEYGYLIHISELEDFEDLKDVAGLENIYRILVIAQRSGCSYIKLDCDGPVYDHLPTFDW